MVNFSKPNGKICHHAEIYYSFADIYFVNLMIISTFASDKENNNIKKNNTTMANKYSGTQKREIVAFKHQLEQAGLEVTMRVSHGREINAACGQLANTYNKFKKK